MPFNTTGFLFFFLVVIVVNSALASRPSTRKIFLLLASYFFYMAWNPPFVVLLIGSTVLDFWVGQKLASGMTAKAKKLWVGLSCFGNLGVLAFFKYGNFITENLWAVIPSATPRPDFFVQIVLPMGISFYTFQSMSYTLDVYRDRTRVTNSFLDFSLYVSFFPQLVAGPIVRSGAFLPQLTENRRANGRDIIVGLDQIARGLAKKVILADGLAVYVDQVYGNPGVYGTWNHLVAVYAYAFQIYFDFSGYTDIAIGTAAILGFRIPENFHLPYWAQGPADFWRRWHISLSTWLRDYLYFSMGGSKRKRWITYRNLLATMVLGGLWHGAAWGFVLWGAFHGLWLVLHRLLYRDRHFIGVPRWLSVMCTFQMVCLGWLLFRAASLSDLRTILIQFTHVNTPIYPIPLDVTIFLCVGIIGHGLGASRSLATRWLRLSLVYKVYWYALLTVMLFLRANVQNQFIYFQF